MSHKTRLTKLEKVGLSDNLWALIGIGKPKDIQHQRLLERQARDNFYASGGNRGAYLAFLSFDSLILPSIEVIAGTQEEIFNLFRKINVVNILSDSVPEWYCKSNEDLTNQKF